VGWNFDRKKFRSRWKFGFEPRFKRSVERRRGAIGFGGSRDGNVCARKRGEIRKVSLRFCGRVKFFLGAGLRANEMKVVIEFIRAEGLEIESMSIDGGICEEAMAESLTG